MGLFALLMEGFGFRVWGLGFSCFSSGLQGSRVFRVEVWVFGFRALGLGAFRAVGLSKLQDLGVSRFGGLGLSGLRFIGLSGVRVFGFQV